MILDNVAVLLSNTARSQAYLQLLAKEKLFPAVCLFLVKNEEELNHVPQKLENSYEKEYFNLHEPLLDTVKTNSINYQIIGTDSINSDECLAVLKNLSCTYIVYSGYGGAILKKPLFEIGKSWIHIHAGLLPEFRGSTTVYYSMLEKQTIGATAMLLNEKIDCGDIIARREFPYPEPVVNIDYIYDPYIRAQLLVQVLKNYSITHSFETSSQSASKGFDYYIIHPVLKHLALLSIQ